MAVVWQIFKSCEEPKKDSDSEAFPSLTADEFFDVADATEDPKVKRGRLLQAIHAHNDQYRRDMPEGFMAKPMKSEATFRLALRSMLDFLEQAIPLSPSS